MEQALSDIRILDFTRVMAGPFATQMLGDLGAQVIKVEPLSGDESRTWPPTFNGGESGYFCALNRNKKSIALNLKDERGKQIAVQLARTVDVIFENFAPGVTKRLGIDYDGLRREKADLIYCSISGYGQYGPYRDKKAYDVIIQGMTGVMSITGESDRPPAKVGIPICDLAAAFYAVTAVEAALLYRKEKGQGQYIDIALYDSAISLLTTMAAEYFATGYPPGRWGMDHAQRIPARAFMCKDGRYIQVTATSETMYPQFCKVIGLPELINDERFITNKQRVDNRAIIMPLLEDVISRKNSKKWLELFGQAGIPCELILDLGEVFEDPNIAARDMLQEVHHPRVGMIKQLGFPCKFSSIETRITSHPPVLGEHTAEILSTYLGYGRDYIDLLRKEKVVGC